MDFAVELNRKHSALKSRSSGAMDAASEFESLLIAIERSSRPSPSCAQLALAQVRLGIITGEGPTTKGRIHFSRTIDAADTAIIRRILEAAGGDAQAPISRPEADILFDIEDSANDRIDSGAFNDLFVKAIAHYVLGASGANVPARMIALSAATPLKTWAFDGRVKGEPMIWLQRRISRACRNSSAIAALTRLLPASGGPVMPSLRAVLDWSA